MNTIHRDMILEIVFHNNVRQMVSFLRKNCHNCVCERFTFGMIVRYLASLNQEERYRLVRSADHTVRPIYNCTDRTTGSICSCSDHSIARLIVCWSNRIVRIISSIHRPIVSPDDFIPSKREVNWLIDYFGWSDKLSRTEVVDTFYNGRHMGIAQMLTSLSDEDNSKLITPHEDEDEKTNQYEGAMVFPPTHHPTDEQMFDNNYYNSIYPSMMVLRNISGNQRVWPSGCVTLL